jgi:hypothetical protein
MHVDAERHGARGNGRREHVSRPASVLADEQAVAGFGKLRGRGTAKVIGKLGMQIDVGDSTNAVRTEQTRHR